ncbi:hypothetical protein [Jannaschia sp. LMIT008]|nr:hypothetical protein [Jannaschia sp. LMIT008]
MARITVAASIVPDPDLVSGIEPNPAGTTIASPGTRMAATTTGPA